MTRYDVRDVMNRYNVRNIVTRYDVRDVISTCSSLGVGMFSAP